MSPYQKARTVYESEPCARTFNEDLELHLRNGWVYSTPTFFLMGRPVVSTAPQAAIVDPRVRFSDAQCDCWHVYLFAGDMREAVRHEPWSLPLVSMERKNELRIYPKAAMSRLAELLSQGVNHDL